MRVGDGNWKGMQDENLLGEQAFIKSEDRVHSSWEWMVMEIASWCSFGDSMVWQYSMRYCALINDSKVTGVRQYGRHKTKV